MLKKIYLKRVPDKSGVTRMSVSRTASTAGKVRFPRINESFHQDEGIGYQATPATEPSAECWRARAESASREAHLYRADVKAGEWARAGSPDRTP